MAVNDKDKRVHIDIQDEDGAASAPSAQDAGQDETAQEPDEISFEDMSEEELVEAAKRAGAAAAEEELAQEAAADMIDLEARAVTAETKLEEAQAALAEAQDRVLRVQADWDNFRRRTAQERLDERARANEKLVTNLLPVIDDLERAIEHSRAQEGDAAAAQLADGVEAIMNKFVDILAHDGVEQICPAGEPFDPLEHQAVGREENASVFDETVAQVYQKGYRMGGKVIRPAMVTVAFGGPKRPQPETPPEGEAASESND